MENFKMDKLFRFAACIACAFAAVLTTTVLAQTYPSKPIRVVVPYAPGGSIDFISRLLALRLTDGMGQVVVVDNRLGAGGTIGIDNVAKAAPDGYTLLVVDPSIVINASLGAKLPYALKDLQPISVLTTAPLVLTVPISLPIKDVSGLLDYARANPGKINFASPGIGTTPHMAGEMLRLRSKLQIVHIPYKGSVPALADLVSGQVQMAFSSITPALPFLKDGRLRGLATSGTQRATALPDLPTVAEAGVPGFEVLFWTTLFAPAGIPQDVLTKLHAETTKALQHPEMRAALARVGETPSGTSVEGAVSFVNSEHAKWAKIIKESGLKAD